MLDFFKSPKASKSFPGEKQDDANPPVADISTESGQDRDASSDPHAQEAHPRVSAASSVPTIDSTPTIQGQPVTAPLPESPNHPSLVPPSPAQAQASASSIHTQSSIQNDRPMQSQSQSALPYSLPENPAAKDPRRFSFPSFSFLRSNSKQNKAHVIPPPLQLQAVSNVPQTKSKAGRTLSVFIAGSAASSEKRAKEAALITRSVIIGGHNAPADSKPNKIKPLSKSDVARVKAQLHDPRTATKVITQLRALPAHPNDPPTIANVPIHAVCLNMTDREVHDQLFAQLQSVATASISAISAVLADVNLVNLVTAPNMGFGAPVSAQGLFAGAVPTAETVIDGMEQITPQLMALGYATGKAILPEHKGVFAPTDRISVLTYWWGFEVCLPPPTIAFLEATESPGSALLNLLTAISVLNEGTREILPFIRYIAQFVQTEWGLIKRADEGKGVVCTATWLLPIALLPHAWDFPDPPLPHTETAAAGQSTPTSPSVKQFSATLTTPKPSTDVTNGVPRSSSAYSTETRDDEEQRPAISSEPPVLPELVVSSPESIDGAPPENVDGRGHHAHDKVQHDGEATAQ